MKRRRKWQKTPKTFFFHFFSLNQIMTAKVFFYALGKINEKKMSKNFKEWQNDDEKYIFSPKNTFWILFFVFCVQQTPNHKKLDWKVLGGKIVEKIVFWRIFRCRFVSPPLKNVDIFFSVFFVFSISQRIKKHICRQYRIQRKKLEKISFGVFWNFRRSFTAPPHPP